MTKGFVIIFAVLLPLTAFADYWNTGIQIDCLPATSELRLHAKTLVNEPAMWAAAPAGMRDKFLKEAKARNFFLESQFDVSCKLGPHHIRVWGEMYEPRERGECGSDPGGEVYMPVNGLPVLHSLNIGNDCFPSAWRASLTVQPDIASSSSRLMLCGHDRFGVSRGKKETCVARSVTLLQPPKPAQQPLFNQVDFERMLRGR